MKAAYSDPRGAEARRGRHHIRVSRRGTSSLCTTPSTIPTSITSSSGTSRAPVMRPTATPGPRARWACAWPPRARRHQPGHGYRQRLHGQRAHGGHHRAGEPAPHRPGLVPGGRHHRHHPAHRQAQLSGQGREQPAAHHPGGLLHRQHRPSRPGGHRHPGRRDQGGDGLRPGGAAGDGASRLQAQPQGPSQADQGGGAAHRRGRAPGHLRRRRRHHRPMRRRSCGSWPSTATSR